MKPVQVRAYQPADFSAVLELVNAAAEVDHTRRTDETLLTPLVSPGPDDNPHTQVRIGMLPGGQVAGMVWWDYVGGTTFRLMGWVHPDQRRMGVGTALLTAAAHYAKGVFPDATLAARAHEDETGAVALLKKLGYTPTRRFYHMSVSLKGKTFAVDTPPNVEFSAFRRDDLEALVEADNEIFADHWGSQPRSIPAYQRDMIELRPHDPSLWVIARVGEDIVAECLCHTSMEGGERDAHVAIVGVRKSWRGRGLGRAVLAEGLRRLQLAGFEGAALNVDADNQTAINLYRSLEMDVVRTRTNYHKRLG